MQCIYLAIRSDCIVHLVSGFAESNILQVRLMLQAGLDKVT